MTLSLAWIRSVGTVEELVFASDSRLRGGQVWDCCPKIMTLPRTDCLISFAGDTSYAYPGDPATFFLFGGFSWRRQDFRIWTLHYDPSIDRFTFRPSSDWSGQRSGRKVVAFAGDAADDARERLIALLRQRRKLTSGGFDMEPFEVLRDMIRSGGYPTIGGAPQIAKVYKYMRTQFFAVRWPDNNGAPHALGRPALSYETFDAPIIDPDSPAMHAARQTLPDEIEDLN